MFVLCSTAAVDESDGPTLEDKLAKSDPEFLQFLKDEGSSEMLGWAADDLSASSSDEADDADSAQQSSAKVKKAFPVNCVYLLGLGRFGFFKFGSIRFSFQSQVLSFGFFRFRYLHTTTMQEYPSV